MDGSRSEAEAEANSSNSAGFEWDADSQLYFHASTGFYHDPVAGWYYSGRDGKYYIYENGNYVPWTSDVVNEPKAHYPCDGANQVFLEHSSGLEQTAPTDQNEMQCPPSEWMEETLINMYLSGYSNLEVYARSSHGDLETNEEERSHTCEDKLVTLASNSAPVSPNDATSKQIEDEGLTKNFTIMHETLGEEEERWLSQYGQVESANNDIPSSPSIDLWDWEMVTEPAREGHTTARLVGCLVRGSSKLHPSLPTRGGLLRTAPVREVHLDLVRVSSGKLYRLRNPSRKYLASLSAYNSSNPTKDWGFPDICANSDSNFPKRSVSQCQSEVIDESAIRSGLSATIGKDHKVNAYRDRAAERRILHGGCGTGPGQKESTSGNFCEYHETSQDMDEMGAAAVDMSMHSIGLNCAKRIMENMGWKEGEALGKSRKGIVEPIQPTFNKDGAGLGWKQTR